MTIAFIHKHASFVPEIEAYRRFFETHDITVTVFDNLQWKENRNPFDVEWFLMGTDFSKRSKAIRIHEYASSSLSPFMWTKNQIKTLFNVKPDYRLFLNDYVRQCFPFNDHVPSGIRNMGINPVSPAPSDKKYDFIYTGSVAPGRKIEVLLDRFTQPALSDKTILILSRDYDALKRKYQQHPNIIFKGPVEQSEVGAYLQQSQYAINYIPNIEPFNQQTSTKLLEYLQNGLPVCTTDYPWMRDFEHKYGGRYFYLNDSLKNLDYSLIRDFDFAAGSLEDWRWEKQIRNSGVFAFLQNHKTSLVNELGR